jgi:DNA sulfur modification protein DndB
MLEGLESRELLRGTARSRAREYDTRTVHSALVDGLISEGWVIEKRNPKSVRLRRSKSPAKLLEDRVWTLLYQTGFAYLCGQGQARLSNPRDPHGHVARIDVAGVDDELALAVVCKARAQFGEEPLLREELEKHGVLRQQFASAINQQFRPEGAPKHQVVLVMFISNIKLAESDRLEAIKQNVLLFDERDLTYYETLVMHLGPAAKYQLFADMLPGKTVAGLAIRVPAIRARLGGFYCYSFSIAPSYLLKISYVSHRAKGRASDVHTYQRMLSRNRLRKIRDYISDDGIFPTNIVVNLDAKVLRFEKIHQEEQENGVLGWLDIRPAYKSAWIIDGQHRLFAYSGHSRASASRLSVLAFEGLPASRQAGLFIDINAKQKSVKQSLLQELYAELHWDAEDPAVRVRAIVSKAVQVLDADPGCALYQRVQTADAGRTETRCITLTSLYGAIERTEFHIAREKKGQVVEYGPLWAGTNDDTLRRTVSLLKNWFNSIRSGSPEWWERGSGEGGGLAMNDGLTACVNVLRSVTSHLAEEGHNLHLLDDDSLYAAVQPYSAALGSYFGSLSEQDRKAFRDLRGVQGQTKRTRMCQQAIRLTVPSFNPPGLEDFIRDEKAQTNKNAKEIIDRIELALQRVVIEELKRECGPEESQWWMVGVPRNVRIKVTERHEEDDGARGGKEAYFDLIDYRRIALDNWQLFEPLLGRGGGAKDKRTSWMVFVNEKRKIVAHASSATSISMEDLGRLEEYDLWLTRHLEVDRGVAGDLELANEL